MLENSWWLCCRPPRPKEVDEFNYVVWLDRILCSPSPTWTWLLPILKQQKLIWVDGNYQSSRDDKLLWKTSWRILKVWSRSGPKWPNLLPWQQLLIFLPFLLIPHLLSHNPFLFGVQTLSAIPSPHLFFLRLYGNNIQKCDGCFLFFSKVQWVVGPRGLTSLLTKCIKA